jgi:hypothetical protein
MEHHVWPDEISVAIHCVAVPQRSDGVAHALQAIYDLDAQAIPSEIDALLARLDCEGPEVGHINPRR